MSLILLTACMVFTDVSNMKAYANPYDYFWEMSLYDNTEWYEGKLFTIYGPNFVYDSVKILRIITLSSLNTMIVFENNGFTMYIPFKNIIKMHESGK